MPLNPSSSSSSATRPTATTPGLKKTVTVVANELYADVKQSTTERYQHHLTTLNAKGVFPPEVNHLRAETMLQVALDRNFKRAVNDAVHGARPSSIPPPRSVSPSSAAGSRKRSGSRRRGATEHGDHRATSSTTQAPQEAKTLTLARRLSELSAMVQRGEELASSNANHLAAATAAVLASSSGPHHHEVGDKSSAFGGDYHDGSPSPASQLTRDTTSAAQSPVDPGQSPLPGSDPSVGNFSSVASYLQVSYQHGDYHDISKEERALMKHRDEAHRAPNPVDRYASAWLANDPKAKQWETAAARLGAEEMTTGKRSTTGGGAGPSRPTSSTSQDALQPRRATASPLPHTKGEVHLASVANTDMQRASRLRHRLEVGRQLAAQSDLVHQRLRFASELGGGVAEETANVESSDEDDDQINALISKPPSAAETSEATRGCELLECTIVCITNLTAKATSTSTAEQRAEDGGAPIERDRAILRNILLHCLSTLKPILRRTAHLVDMESNEPTTLPPFAYRLLRSWTKGVEVLLSIDLDLPRGMPFAVLNPEHLDAMIRYYCVCQRAADQHATALMAQWRRNADRAIGVSRVIGQGTDLSSVDKSMAAGGVSATEEANRIMNALRNYAGVPMGELTRMDVAEANLRFRQKELAAAFLARFSPYLPAMGNMPSSTSSALGHFEDSSTEHTPAQLNRSKPDHHLSSNAAGLTSPRANAAASRLRAMLLRYTGFEPSPTGRLSAASQQPGLDSTASFASSNEQLIVNAMSAQSMESFLNVFKSTWGRTPLVTAGVDVNEKRMRAQAMEHGLVAQLLRQYWELLGEAQHGQMLKRVELEVQRVADIDARQAAQDVAFRRATGVVPREIEEQRQREQEGATAVATVTKQHLVDKYSKVENNEAQLSRIRKAIERTDEWIGHEADKRAIKAEGLFDTSAAPAVVQSPTSQRSPSPAGGGEEEAKATSKLEALRLRRLRELELAWQELAISYVQRLALHDKWNAADLKSVDKAAKLYTECVLMVKQREASVEGIIVNESNTDERTRAIKRHELFTEMCSAGQRCEVAAKRLRAEVGDTLYYRDFVYTDKMKDDFTMVSRLLKAPAARGLPASSNANSSSTTLGKR